MVSIKQVDKSFFQNFGFISVIGDFILINSLFLLAVLFRYDDISPVHEKDLRTLVIFMNMTWFTVAYRTFTVTRRGKPTVISWKQLMQQVGAQYRDVKNFKRKVKEALHKGPEVEFLQ